MSTGRHVVMLCTAARGGMRSVVEGYARDGLFARWNVRLIDTHAEGSVARRLAVAARAMGAFGALLARRRVRLVHCHVAMKGSFWRKSMFVALARAARVPVILHLHGSEFADFHARQPRWRQGVIGRVFAMADRVLVLSDRWAAFVAGASPRARVEVMPNYVVLPGIAPRGEEDGLVRVLFLGFVGRRKGVYDLLPAFRDAAADAPALRLGIGGNGEIDAARQTIGTLGLADRVALLGWIAGAARDAELARADLFVLPSYNEGLPMSILEAMAAGKPVISTRAGGIPELVRDGIDGLIVDAGDTAALSRALSTLGGNAALRQRMGASARERVATRYSREAVLPRIEALYAALAGKADAEPRA